MAVASTERATARSEQKTREQIPAPPSPRTLEETGLNSVLLGNLALKFLAVRGAAVGNELANDLRIPFPILEPILTHLKEQKLVEVAGGDLMGPVSYRFALTNAGRDRAREATSDCQYIGPAPVPLEQYIPQARLQSVRGIACTRETLDRVFRHLVLADGLIDELGPSLVSGRSILIYGPPGSGKTAISRALGEFLNSYGGAIWIPHALLAEDSVITLFDPLLHRTVDPDPEPLRQPRLEDMLSTSREQHDARWICIRRPAVVVGGELTMEMLDLRYSSGGNFYQAPLHLKANGGVFLIDDFGRQIVSPRNLLNRWILPLEERQDFLTLATGKKIAVPFEEVILFSTNLDPQHLTDEAFLRRIRHKIVLQSPDRAAYEKIFTDMCHRLDMRYKPEIVEYLYNQFYKRGRKPRSSDPRDLLEIVEAICRFRQLEIVLNEELISEAALRFFGEL